MKKLILLLYLFFAMFLAVKDALAQERQEKDTIYVSDKVNRYELTASPNPFENEVTITLTEGNKNLTAIRICNILGSEVAFIDLKNRSGILSYKLDFSGLPSGVYFCTVYGSEGIIATKRLSHKK